MRQYDVLVVGGGFGGMFTARGLEKLFRGRSERVMLVAPDNFFSFHGLLPEAASGTLEPRHAVTPLRHVLPRTEVVTGEVASLDIAGRRAKVVDLNDEVHEIAYRVLVLAPGSVPSVLPIPGLADHAVGFSTLADAIWLRNRVLRQLDAAETTNDLGLRRQLLTFTFVGGGYSGVEALAELESLARDATRSFRHVSMRDMRWVLVEAAGSLLPGIDPRLAAYTTKNLRGRGVEVHLGTRLDSCQDGYVRLSDPTVAPYRCEVIVWTTGQRPSPLARESGLTVDERGRVVVDDHLRAAVQQGVFALGDAAAVPNPDGGLCPPTALHAYRQAGTCARNVAAHLGVGTPVPFHYRNRFLAVTLGRNQGVVQLHGLPAVRGFPAWWMGRTYHLLLMPGLGRKARVVSDWTLALAFPRDVSQLGNLGRPNRLTAPGASPRTPEPTG
jgi:NADH dehydrogenase